MNLNIKLNKCSFASIKAHEPEVLYTRQLYQEHYSMVKQGGAMQLNEQNKNKK
jgi:hypothetical protein